MEVGGSGWMWMKLYQRLWKLCGSPAKLPLGMTAQASPLLPPWKLALAFTVDAFMGVHGKFHLLPIHLQLLVVSTSIQLPFDFHSTSKTSIRL